MVVTVDINKLDVNLNEFQDVYYSFSLYYEGYGDPMAFTIYYTKQILLVGWDEALKEMLSDLDLARLSEEEKPIFELYQNHLKKSTLEKMIK